MHMSKNSSPLRGGFEKGCVYIHSEHNIHIKTKFTINKRTQISTAVHYKHAFFDLVAREQPCMKSLPCTFSRPSL